MNNNLASQLSPNANTFITEAGGKNVRTINSYPTMPSGASAESVVNKIVKQEVAPLLAQKNPVPGNQTLNNPIMEEIKMIKEQLAALQLSISNRGRENVSARDGQPEYEIASPTVDEIVFQEELKKKSKTKKSKTPAKGIFCNQQNKKHAEKLSGSEKPIDVEVEKVTFSEDVTDNQKAYYTLLRSIKAELAKDPSTDGKSKKEIDSIARQMIREMRSTPSGRYE